MKDRDSVCHCRKTRVIRKYGVDVLVHAKIYFVCMLYVQSEEAQPSRAGRWVCWPISLRLRALASGRRGERREGHCEGPGGDDRVRHVTKLISNLHILARTGRAAAAQRGWWRGRGAHEPADVPLSHSRCDRHAVCLSHRMWRRLPRRGLPRLATKAASTACIGCTCAVHFAPADDTQFGVGAPIEQ
jgi:hypothetical protein